MDEKTRERINAVAKSLKSLHLAATDEEAEMRAKKIVEESKGEGKSLKELFETRETLESEAKQEHKSAEHNIEDAKDLKNKTKETKEQLNYDIKVHKLEKSGVKEATKNVDELECAAKDAEYIVKEAEKVQKKKSK